MKRYVKASDDAIRLNINMEVVMEFDSDNNYYPVNIASSSHELPMLPKGPFPSGKKGDIIGVQALADYHAFIESIESLVEDYYNLQICYRNESKDESHYYTCLAKDNSGDFILDFSLRIRIANHDAHDTPQASANKRDEKHLMHQFTKGKKLKVLFISLVLNEENEEVSTYDEAYLWMDEQIERKVEIMKRRLKYNK